MVDVVIGLRSWVILYDVQRSKSYPRFQPLTQIYIYVLIYPNKIKRIQIYSILASSLNLSFAFYRINVFTPPVECRLGSVRINHRWLGGSTLFSNQLCKRQI